MLTHQELLLVTTASRRFSGPNAWGWAYGYRLSLGEAIQQPGFG